MNNNPRSRGQANLLLLFISIVLASASGTANSAVFDDFNQWTVLKSKNTQVTEANKRLEITINSTAQGDNFSAGYKANCKLQGDFDIQASYSLINYPEPTGVRVGIGIEDPKTNLAVNAHQLDGEYVADFCAYNACSSRIPTNDKKGKFRLVREGDILDGYYWDNSSSDWVLINSSDSYTKSDVVFSIFAWSHDYAFYDKTTKVAFDDVIINKGTCKY